MKITKIETKIVRIPVETPYVFSHGVLRAFSNVVVWVWTDDGIVGIGESSFVPGGGVSEETPESTKPMIDHYLAPEIIGEGPFDIELIHKKMDAVVPRNLIAKSGIDLALWDIMGKALDLPAYKLLGGEYKPKILATYTLSIDTPEKMAEQAEIRKSLGYLTLVVKIGHEPEYDIERLKLVREAVGPEVKIRLDANEAYRPDQAIKIIRRMEKYDPEFVEEPVKRWDIDGMARVARAVDTPISSDESNTTLESAKKIIEKEAADILNIKISKNGGLFRSKKIAALAESAGIPCIVGGANTYEIGRQACRHFATSTAQAQMGLGSEGCAPASQSKIDDVTEKVVTYEDISRMEGYVVALPGPGLGVELDGEKIKKYAVS
ncbi:MAG: mandelate racemase/muconate lactonizing enzyme family protein [Deltaproteobacteria bacterium]|nr:mandelate racemase/muconate lactonizing enzyme family protein [Deltaproteobacteria bacterium]